VGVVTRPFEFEGKRRGRQAEEGLEALKQAVDALIVIPNNKLLEVASADMPLLDSFKKADEVLLHAVQGISDLIMVDGLINVDFADVRTIMVDQGMALMGTGIAVGPNRATEAAQMAVHSPLLDDVKIDGAMGILINITGGRNMTLKEVSEASTYIHSLAHEDANIIFGSVINEAIGDAIKITVIATGFGPKQRPMLRRDLLTERTPAPPRAGSLFTRRASSSPPAMTASAPVTPLPDYTGARPQRSVSFEEAASKYGVRTSSEAARTIPPATPAFDTEDIAVEDEYDVPAFQRRMDPARQ
jgi:cell division protein FtsZ